MQETKIKDNDLFISNSWSCFFATCLLYPHLEARYFSFFSVLFQPHRNREVKGGYLIYIMEWNSNSSSPYIKSIVSYPQWSNVLWCPTLVLLSQMRILLSLSGSYGYDRNCWFQAKRIIKIRNELPSSCLGSLHKKLNW